MREKILVILLFIAVFVNFLGPIKDIDFPFHIKTGEYISVHKAIPKDDPFTFYGEGTFTDREKFYLSQYWLAQLVFYKLSELGGSTGVIILRAIILSLFVFLLWQTVRGKWFFSSLVIAALVVTHLQPNKLDRPQLFSYLFLLLLILLFEKFRETPESAKPLFFVPPLMLLWSNMHAGFVFGLVLILIYTASETSKFFMKKMKPEFAVGKSLPAESLLKLLIAGLLAVLFSYVNPDGNGQIIEAIGSHTTAKWLYYRVREYMSPLQETAYPYAPITAIASFWIIFGYVAIIFALNVMRKKVVDITTFALLLFSSYAALTSVRYTPFFLAVAIPVTREYGFFQGGASLSRLSRKTAVVIPFAIFFILAISYGLRDYKHMFEWQLQRYCAEGASRFLLQNQIDANMYNSTNKGSYLIWRLYPHYKVFQDTRHISLEATKESDKIVLAVDSDSENGDQSLGSALSDLVPRELGKIRTLSGNSGVSSQDKEPLWKGLLKKHNIDLIVHEATGELTGQLFPLTLRLLKDDEWVLIYLDGVVEIFVRNVPKYKDIIAKFGKPKELVYDEIILEMVSSVRGKTTYAAPYSSLAFALMMKGKTQDAQKMLTAALELDKNDFIANFCNAYLALLQKREERNSKQAALMN